MTTDEMTLRAEKIKVEAKIAVAEAAKRNMALDLEVVAKLIGRNVKFDRKFLTFLEQYAKA